MKSEEIHKIFNILPASFEETALDIFQFQYKNNEVYRSFVQAIGRSPDRVSSINEIPFLPISLFKSHRVITTSFIPELVFESSGTSGSASSRHFIKDVSLYRTSFNQGFRHFYGDPEDWCIIGLLPSYLERKHSSLVMMVDELIKKSGKPASGFYLNEHEKLALTLHQLEKEGQKTLLIGVSFALLDFAASYPQALKNTVIMETGGMKGRREEMIRQELHAYLCSRFQVPLIHSEYGMTELLSQAYSKGDGVFNCPPWMKIFMREEDDPMLVKEYASSGLINLIDLANIYSCSFIATDDAGKLHADGSFEVTGRMDNSDIRGCSLMISGL